MALHSPRMFASMFSMSVFLIFGYCLTTICYLAYDPDARFFIGRWPLWGLLWVPIFGIAHWWHLKRQRPSRSVMMACVFGPATTFFIIGWVVMHRASRLHTVLRSSDCSRAAEFKEFNDAALAARAFHNKCLEGTKEPLLIHYCPGYEDEKAVDNRAQTWEYLKYAEHNYGCAGFCNVAGDPSMWTYQGFQDSCASATANVMKSKVAALAFQMMVYNIFVVVTFLIWIEIMTPTLKAIDRGEQLPEREKPFYPMRGPLPQGGPLPQQAVSAPVYQSPPMTSSVMPPQYVTMPPPPAPAEPSMAMPPPTIQTAGPMTSMPPSMPPMTSMPPSMPPMTSMGPPPPSMMAPPGDVVEPGYVTINRSPAYTSSRLDS